MDGEWISMDDFTSAEFDDFENFEDIVEREAVYLDVKLAHDEMIDAMMTSDEYYDRVVGGF